MAERLKDRMWFRQSFMLPEGKITDTDMRRRLMSTASFKFTDTTLGGNFAVNAPPSYSRFADPRMGGKFDEGRGIAFMRSTGRMRVTAMPQSDLEDEIEDQMTSPSSGMGPYYSEAIDDNAQLVVMRFGVPAYNSLSSFFGNFYSADAAMLARTGRLSDNVREGMFTAALSAITGAAGSLLGSMLALPFQPIILLGAMWRKMSNAPASKFYYLKPAMATYWGAVQTMVNGIGVNLGIVPQALTPGQQSVFGESSDQYGASGYSKYVGMMKDIITEDGYIDVYALATKAQRRANRYNENLKNRLDNDVKDMRSLAEAIRQTRAEMMTEAPSSFRTFSTYIAEYASLEFFRPYASGGTVLAGDTVVENAGGDSGSSAGDDVSTDSVEQIGDRQQFNDTAGNRVIEFLKGELRDGANFVTFRVDYTGTSSESFSNEVGESSIAQKLNSASASARSARFDFADGNVGFGIGTVFNAARNFAEKTIDKLGFSGLAALFGSAFVDIPHVWQQSMAQLPSANFTMELRSPYANRLSQMQNLYIPLSMLLAGALPLATGKQSYTSPFICELYCKGRVNIRLGIIDSISIERGVGNVGWNNEGYALGMNVTFSVKDLSTVMAIPVTTQFGTGETLVNAAAKKLGGVVESVTTALTKSMYDDDNTFTDYLATLGSLSFQDMVYFGRKWRLRRMMLQREVDRVTSPAYWASNIGSTMPGFIMNALALETDRGSTTI